MEKEQLSPGHPDVASIGAPDDDATIDLESTHEVAQKGQEVLELSKELNNSSKALLEQIEPIV